MRRSQWERMMDRRDALRKAEAAGTVADSLDYRKGLIEKMKRGEATLEEIQADLAKTKRNAKENGLATRAEVYRRG